MDRKRRIRRRRRVGRNIHILLGVVVLTLGGILVVPGAAGEVLSGGHGGGREKETSAGETKQQDSDARGDVSSAAVMGGKDTAMDAQAAARGIFEEQKELLVLVNKEHPLSADYDAGLRKICNGRLEASEVMYNDLVNMLADAEKSGYTYWIASAHRSRAKQERLMEEEIEKNMRNGLSREDAEKKSNETLMTPGYSEHETGLALDMLCSGNMNMDVSQEAEKGNQWLRENGWKYGFVLRYPKEKEEVTEINYEPWHFRYVGIETAAYLHENDLTLEEFYQLLD